MARGLFLCIHYRYPPARASIEKAYRAGVMVGISEGVFGLGQPVTREQFAVILDRLGLLEKGGA